MKNKTLAVLEEMWRVGRVLSVIVTIVDGSFWAPF
jgi:hypothetical protein